LSRAQLPTLLATVAQASTRRLPTSTRRLCSQGKSLLTMSTANWPPPWFEYLPDFMPKEKVLGLLEEISANAEDIRVVAEKAMSSAEKAMSAMAELIASNDKEIITYVRELSQYRLVYEWRGILDWCVRVIFSSSPKSSSGLLWKNFATQNSSVIDKVFTSVQPHFPVSFQVVDRIRKRFVDVYDAANGVMGKRRMAVSHCVADEARDEYELSSVNSGPWSRFTGVGNSWSGSVTRRKAYPVTAHAGFFMYSSTKRFLVGR